MDSDPILPVLAHLSAKQLEILNQYYSEVSFYNEALGLVKFDSRDDFFTKHIADSLIAVDVISPYSRPGEVVVDIGSGAGLPGIPLSVAFPEVRFILVERMHKRSQFITNFVLKAGLKNVSVAECDVKELKRNFANLQPNSFDLPEGGLHLATMRAVASPEMEVSALSALFGRGGDGTAFLYKGRAKNIDLLEYKDRFERCEVVPLPESEWGERNLLVLSGPRGQK